MRILFLVYHGFSEYSGISKKIHYQVKGLRENGHDVRLCYYGFANNGHRCRYIDDIVIKDYGTGQIAAIRQRMDYNCIYDYCIREQIEFVYARCFQNANPWLICFFKKLRNAGIHTVTEIPTYPYDSEFTSSSDWNMRLGLWIDKKYRNSLYPQMDAVVTFSDAKEIFGQRTINISNGVDFDSIPQHKLLRLGRSGPLHLIGVAEVHFWHGFDRLIAGLGEYYKKGGEREVFFHIVGGVHPDYMWDMPEAPGFQTLIDKYDISDKVIFHGTMFGDQLDDIFNNCQFAIGSLARHRSGITVIKTLKNREYATRGIPFIYSEQDSDFDGQPYVLKAPADESPIDINQIIYFIDHFEMKPTEIRKSVEHLKWSKQMNIVVNTIFNTNEKQDSTKLHIMYVYPEFSIKGGADKVVIEKANYLVNEGYKITIVTESQMGRDFSFAINPSVKHIDLSLDFNKQYNHNLIRRAYVYYSLLAKYRNKLSEILAKESPDILISTLGRSIDVIPYMHDTSVKIGEAHSIKEHMRSFYLMKNRGYLHRLIAKYMFWKTENSVSRLRRLVLLTKDDAESWNGIVETTVIPNSIPIIPNDFARLVNKQAIIVGRYNDAKGYNYILDAWTIVHQRHPDWLLNVYGSGELHDQVAHWIQDKNLDGTVIMHDPTNQIMEKYLESSICVMSSRYEGFPMALLEAMTCGVPCVSFDCPHGPRNIIRNGEDGLLVDYLDTNALAKGICDLIENQALRKKMGFNARNNIQRYSRINVMKQWEELFNELTKK